MSWFLFAFIGAVISSAAALLEKKTLFKEHAMEFAAVLALVNAVLTLPLFFLIDYSTFNWSALPIIFVIALLAAIAFVLITKAMRHMEISSVSPLRLLSPGVVALLAFLLLDEYLVRMQVFGIMLVMVGLCVLEMRYGFFAGIKDLRSSKYVRYAMLSVLLYGLTSVGDRFVFSRFGLTPIAYTAFVHLFLAIVFIFMLMIFHDGFRGIEHGLRYSGWWILAVAVLTVGYRFMNLTAVSMAPVGLAEAVKQTSVFFTILLGGEIFHEKNILKKLVASAIMIAGVVLLVR